jgi:hypothetical protein
LRRKSLFRFALRASGALLLLHRLAFPPSGHHPIIASADAEARLPVSRLRHFQRQLNGVGCWIFDPGYRKIEFG